MIGWILLLFTAGMATTNPWWLGGFLMLALWKAQRWYFLKGRPWRRVHYPLMRIYAGMAGAETNQAEQDGTEFNFSRALTELLRTAYPEDSDAALSEKVEKVFTNVQLHADLPIVMSHVKRKNPALSAGEMEDGIEKLKSIIQGSDNYFLVCTAISGVIEDRYGIEAKAEYLYEVLAGRAT